MIKYIIPCIIIIACIITVWVGLGALGISKMDIKDQQQVLIQDLTDTNANLRDSLKQMKLDRDFYRSLKERFDERLESIYDRNFYPPTLLVYTIDRWAFKMGIPFSMADSIARIESSWWTDHRPGKAGEKTWSQIMLQTGKLWIHILGGDSSQFEFKEGDIETPTALTFIILLDMKLHNHLHWKQWNTGKYIDHNQKESMFYVKKDKSNR